MGDHMILQQNSSVKLWGWADNKKVTVTTSWNNQTYQVLTDKNGAWLVKVDTPGASYTPYSITISDGEDVILSDILIGEVWICSGQSNMDMRMMGNTGQPIDRWRRFCMLVIIVTVSASLLFRERKMHSNGLILKGENGRYRHRKRS